MCWLRAAVRRGLELGQKEMKCYHLNSYPRGFFSLGKYLDVGLLDGCGSTEVKGGFFSYCLACRNNQKFGALRGELGKREKP